MSIFTQRCLLDWYKDAGLCIGYLTKHDGYLYCRYHLPMNLRQCREQNVNCNGLIEYHMDVGGRDWLSSYFCDAHKPKPDYSFCYLSSYGRCGGYSVVCKICQQKFCFDHRNHSHYNNNFQKCEKCSREAKVGGRCYYHGYRGVVKDPCNGSINYDGR